MIARRIGVSEPTLYRWRDEFMAAGEAALANGSGKKGADPRDRRIAELEAADREARPGDRRVHDRQPHFKKTFGPVRLSAESREMIRNELASRDAPPPRARQTAVLRLVGIAPSSWHRVPREGERKRPGPARRPIADEVVQAVVEMATANPWYGYKRIAVMCRRAGQAVKDREAYVVMRDHGLLQKPQPRRAELYQAAKLFELLPQGPNDLWQMDVTYIHIPGYGWWYAVTVIDYYSRYLLACHLTLELQRGRDGLRLEAGARGSGADPRPAGEASVLGDRQRAVVHRPAVHGIRPGSVQPRADPVPHAAAVGPVGAVPSDAQDRRSVLAAVRSSAALPRVPGRVPRSLQRASAALGAGARRRWRCARAGRRVCRRRTIQIPRWQAWARAAQAKLEKMMEDAA